MKTAYMLICSLMWGCDRTASAPSTPYKDAQQIHSEAPDPLQPKTLVPPPSTISTEIDVRIWEAVSEMARPERSQQGMAKFRELAGSLAKQDRLAQTISILGRPGLTELADLVRPIFNSKRAKNEYDLEYLAALKVLNESTAPPPSEDLIEDLDRVPPYVFPSEAPNPWDAANAVHIHKGYPGQIALALVSRNDAKTQSLYRQKLNQASGSLQAVLIWALGHSTRIENFNYLLSLYRLASGDEKALIVRSLNRIPLSIEQAAATSMDPVEKKRLTALMSELRRQLMDLKLNVELTVWD